MCVPPLWLNAAELRSGRVPQPNKELFSLADYRTRYASYRSDPDLQLLHQTHAWQLIWDDHEVADNTWKAGSVDSNDTIAGSTQGIGFTERKANAVKTYFEWLPIRTVCPVARGDFQG
jgi:alkaline phosphatase D